MAARPSGKPFCSYKLQALCVCASVEGRRKKEAAGIGDFTGTGLPTEATQGLASDMQGSQMTEIILPVSKL